MVECWWFEVGCKVDWPAWVQAVGSVLAIIAAALIAYWQNREASKERRVAFEEKRKSQFLVVHHLSTSLLANLIFILEEKDNFLASFQAIKKYTDDLREWVKDVPYDTFNAQELDSFLEIRFNLNQINMMLGKSSPSTYGHIQLGAKRLNQVSRLQIQTFHSGLLEEGLAAATANHHVKLIRHMLNLAVEWEMLDKNPASRIHMFAEDNKIERYMNDVQLANLLEVLRTDSSRSVCLIAMFLLATGCRLNEAISACWVQVDKDKRVWRIPASNSKSKRLRPVPLNSTALDVLNQLNTEGVYTHLFINRKTKKPYVNIAKVWERIRSEAGLPHLRLHDLRHQAASNLINSGSNLYIVQQILGHSDPSVTQRYAHLSMKSLNDASDNASVITQRAKKTESKEVAVL